MMKEAIYTTIFFLMIIIISHKRKGNLLIKFESPKYFFASFFLLPTWIGLAPQRIEGQNFGKIIDKGGEGCVMTC